MKKQKKTVPPSAPIEWPLWVRTGKAKAEKECRGDVGRGMDYLSGWCDAVQWLVVRMQRIGKQHEAKGWMTRRLKEALNGRSRRARGK